MDYMQIAELADKATYILIALVVLMVLGLTVSLLSKEIKVEEKRNYRSYRNADMNKGEVLMDEAYTFQLWKAMDIQHEIKKLQTVSGVLAIREYEIQLKIDYFTKVASLFDEWHFRPIKSDTYDHEVWGYINKKKFVALCTVSELVEILADNTRNFAKDTEKIQPTEKTPKIEPLLSDLFEKVFGGSR